MNTVQFKFFAIRRQTTLQQNTYSCSNSLVIMGVPVGELLHPVFICLATKTSTKKSNEDKSNPKKSKQSKEERSKTKKNNKKSSKTQTDSFRASPSRCTLLDNGRQSDTTEDNLRQKRTMLDNREKLEGQIRAFLDDCKRSELVFSTDLLSQERFTVHRLAEEFGLEHVSKGTGEERFIAVAKKPTSPHGKKMLGYALNLAQLRQLGSSVQHQITLMVIQI